MIIKRKSPVSGQENVMDLPISAADILNISTGRNIRNVCPQLSEAEIEFYLTGRTVEEQNE